MAKANVHYVDAQFFAQTLLASGASVIPQAGFMRVETPNGARLYVARTKRVGRVDLTFKMEGPGFRELPEGERIGSVTHQIDFSQPPEITQDAFEKALATMAGLPKVEKAKAEKKAKGAAPAAQGWPAEMLKATKAVSTASPDGVSLALKISLRPNGKPLSAGLIAKLNDVQRAEYDAHWTPAEDASSADGIDRMAADKG